LSTIGHGDHSGRLQKIVSSSRDETGMQAMADLMSSKEWLKLTDGGMMSRRSSALKRLDAALAAYEKTPTPALKDAVHRAFIAWAAEKGGNYQSSIRNSRNAVDTLFRQLTGMAAPAAGNSAGLAAMRDETHQTMLIIFRGAKITWKIAFQAKMGWELLKPTKLVVLPVQGVRQYAAMGGNNKVGITANAVGVGIGASTVDTLRRGGTVNSGAGAKAMSQLISQIVPQGAQAEVMSAVQAIVPSFTVQFSAAVMPLAGILVAAGGTFWNSGKALHKQYGIRDARIHRDRSLAGVEARGAVDALIRILERERNADIYNATVSITELGGKIAGLAIDAGTASNTAIGLAANIAKLLNIVRIIYRDVSEKNEANRLMLQGKVGIEIFEVCPLLGAYLVCCLSTSGLMGLIFERFGQEGWMDVAERTNERHLEPLRQKTRAVIKEHHFEIRTLARFPGMLEVNKNALAEVKKRYVEGQFSPEGFGPNNLPEGLRAG
jgi:hypothetical protein